MEDDNSKPEDRGFAYWSGYTPAKTTPDGTLTALNGDELRDRAARFRRRAKQALDAGDATGAALLEAAADDFERRADAVDG